jgi:hypothetical protein
MPRGLVAIAILSLAAIAISVVAIVMTVTRPSSTADDCRTLAWDALPDPAGLPDGWSLTATNFYVGGVGTSLVGTAPSDGSSGAPTVYLQVTCYGNDSHLAMTRSHDSAIAAGDKEVSFADFGDESFATTDAASSGTAVYIRQGPLVATLAAQGGIDQGELQQAASAVADGMAGAGSIAAGPGSSPEASAAAVEPTDTSGSEPSASDAPSHVAPDLEAMLPKTLAGAAMSTQSTSGTAGLGDDQTSQSLVASLAKLGKKQSDLEIAEGYDPDNNVDVQVIAFRANGVKASALGQAVLDSYLADGASGVVTTRKTISGKPVTQVDYGDGGSFDYLYEKGDVVFDVSTSDPSIAAETLKALP